MADNVTADAGSGGATFAADDIGGVHYPRAKVVWGADGAASDASAAAPLPVKLTTAASAEIGVAAVPLQVSLANHGANATAVKVDGSAVTQPVSHAALTELAAAIDTELQVDVVAALPAGTNNIGDVDVLTVITGTGATNLGKAEDAAHSSGDVGVMALAVRKDTAAASSGTTGDYEPLSTNATGQLWVEVGASALPSGAGTAANQTTIISHLDGLEGLLTTVDADTSQLVDVAHDAADSNNPVKMGAKAINSLSGATMVATADRTNLYAGIDGVLIVRPNTNLEDIVQERATNTDGASTAFASGLAAPGAGIRLYVKSVTIANSSASFATVDLRDGSGGSVLWTFPVPATGGVTHVFDPPLKLTANTALAYDASAATSTISISVNGFKSKV